MPFVCHSKILHKHCVQFLLGVKMAPRETENNAYAKFWGDKQSIMVRYDIFWRGQYVILGVWRTALDSAIRWINQYPEDKY